MKILITEDDEIMLKAANKNPITYSWLPMVYRSMSNGTDLTSFLDAGYAGLNFAVAEGVENYSSPTDDIHHLDRGTAYNFMKTAFDISDHVASVSLDNNNGNQDGVYFTLLPGLLVLMNGLFSRFLAGIAVIGSIVWLIWQWRKRSLKPLQTLTVTGLQLATIAASALLSAGVFIVFPLLNRKRTFSEVISGALLMLVPLALCSAIFFNAMSYLFTLPLMGLLALTLFSAKATITRSAMAALVSILLLLLYVPVCWLLYMTLGLEILALIMAISAIPVTLIASCIFHSRTNNSPDY